MRREREVYDRKRYGKPSAQSKPFAKYSGSVSEGKLRLAEYGGEASEPGRGEASAAVSTYLVAISTQRWEEACGQLAKASLAQLEKLPGQAPGTGCAQQLPRMIELLEQSSSARVASASQGIASLRIKEGGRAGEGTGFALFHGDDGKDYWVAVRLEGGHWRLLSAIPQPFTS